RRDHDRAGLRLPPRVDDGAAFVADDVVVPHPRLGIDRFADGAEEAEGTEVVFVRPLIAPAHERADGSRRGVKDGDFVFVYDAPEAVGLGPIRCPFVHEGGRAVGGGAVGGVAVAGDPADVGGAPECVLLFQVEDVFRRQIHAEQIAGGAVQYALGFTGAAAGVENVERMFAIEFFGGAIRVDELQFVVPPDIAALLHFDFGIGAAEDDDSGDGRALW